MATPLNFDRLRTMSQLRQQEWPGSSNATLEFRTIEVAGETGELMEVVKKYLRGRDGIAGRQASRDEIRDEMAGVIIAVDLLAARLHIDLSVAITNKFNRTSEKYNLATTL